MNPKSSLVKSCKQKLSVAVWSLALILQGLGITEGQAQINCCNPALVESMTVYTNRYKNGFLGFRIMEGDSYYIPHFYKQEVDYGATFGQTLNYSGYSYADYGNWAWSSGNAQSGSWVKTYAYNPDTDAFSSSYSGTLGLSGYYNYGGTGTTPYNYAWSDTYALNTNGAWFDGTNYGSANWWYGYGGNATNSLIIYSAYMQQSYYDSWVYRDSWSNSNYSASYLYSGYFYLIDSFSLNYEYTTFDLVQRARNDVSAISWPVDQQGEPAWSDGSGAASVSISADQSQVWISRMKYRLKIPTEVGKSYYVGWDINYSTDGPDGPTTAVEHKYVGPVAGTGDYVILDPVLVEPPATYSISQPAVGNTTNLNYGTMGWSATTITYGGSIWVGDTYFTETTNACVTFDRGLCYVWENGSRTFPIRIFPPNANVRFEVDPPIAQVRVTPNSLTVSGLTNGYATIRAVFGSNVIASTSLAVVGIRYPWRTIFLKNSAPVTITPEILPWGVGATFMMTNAQTWPWHDPAPLGDQTFSLQFDGYNLTVRGAIEFTTAGIAAAAGDLPYRVGATVANAGDVRSDLSARYEDGVVRISRFGNERFSYGINIYRDNVTRLADPSMLVTFPGGWFDDYSVLPGNTYVYRANRAIPYYTNITALLSGTVVSGLEFERSGYGLDKTIPSTSLMFIGGGGHDAAGYAEGNHFMMSSPVFYHLWSGGIGYTSPPAVYANNGIDMRGFLNDEYYLQHPEDRLFPDSLLSTITIPPASPVLFGVSRGNTNLLSWSVPYGATGFYVKRAQNSNGPYATLSQVPQTDWQFADPVTSGGGTYYYVVSAVNAGGEGPDSDPINPGSNPLPEAPAELTVYTTNGQVVLNWSAVSNAGSYRIRRSTLSGSSYQLIEATTNVTYTDGTVVAGNTYYYVVAGQNQYGYGQESTEIALTLKPATPEGLTAAAGTNQVSLIWTPSMGTVSYSILRATNASGPYVQVNTNAQPSYVDESVVGGLTYYYAISASNAGGQSVESQAVSVRPYRPAVLPTPQMLFALSGNQQVSLQWLPATGVTNYLVKRSLITGGPYRFVAAISGTNYVDANLINGLTYFYVVEAAEGIPATAQAQIDTNSQVVTNVALLSPGVGYLEPPMVMLVDGTGSGAAATVQLTNDMVSGFTITNGGSSYLTAPEVVLSGGFAESLDSNEAMGKPMPPLPGPPTLPSVIAGDGQAILTWSASTWADGYVVSRSQFSGGPYDYLGSVTGTNFTNSGLINGLVYYYTLVATNLSGSSATSPEAMITLPPNSPTGLTATATGRRVNLIWNPVTYASGYRILRSTNDGGPYAPVQVVNDTNWEDSRLGFGTTYYYEVSAVNSGGDGLPSVQASATTDPLIIDNAPTLTKVRTFRMAFENTAFPITYERLLAMSDAADADGDLILFSIESVDSGILQMNGTNISAGQALLGPGQSLMWTPFTNSYGAGVAAFSVKVNDGAMSSEVAVTVNVDVAATAKVATWGKQVYADLSFGGGQCNVIPAIVTMLTNTVEVAAGYYHSLARCADGSVWVWGEGQSGQNPPVGSSSPMLVIGISNAVSIASGYDTCYVLQPNGDIYAWGFGSIAMPITRIATVTNAIALAGDLAVLTANGTVLKWNASLYEMQPAGGVNDAREISTSAFGQSLILRTNGTVWSFPGVGGDTSVASAVAGLENVVGIATGDSHYLALKADGTVWAWGFNTYGQIGQGEHTNDNYSTPLQVPGLSNIVTVAAGWDHSFAQNASGMIWAWGLNSDGQLGTGWDINSLGFRFFEDYPDSDGILDSPTRLVGITNLVGLSGGRYHSLGVGTDGTAWAWGSDFTGALGVGYVAPLVPAANSSLNDIAEVAEGFGFHLALRTNGTVLAWGNNYYYSLGTGSIEPTNRFTPGLVVGLTNVIRIAAGGMHGVALKNDSTVWAWGWGYYNQLGNKGKKSSPNPVQLSTLNDVIDIACGFSHSIALKSDGSVWEWGGNPLMEDGMSSATPISVFGLSNITSIAAAQFHNLAVSVDGRVLAWGKNYYGILGNGTTNDSVLPVPVLDLSNIVAVAAGDYHSMALDSEGKVYVWGGIPGYSTLGLGTAVTTTLNPICLNTLTNVTAISAGGWHSCAVTDDGTVWSWGAGTSGQIGDGYAESRFVPTVVVGLTNATGVSAGYDSGIALAVLLPPGITGVAAQPADGRVALTWNPYSLASEFYVKRSTNQGASYSVIATVTTNGYVDTSVNDGTTYSYVISAAGTTGESPNSRGVTVTPLAPPPAPTNFVATPLGRQVALNWTATPTAASYKVRRAQVSGGPYTQIATVTNTSYVDTRLFNGTAYYYIVSGINCGGEGSPSVELSAIPDANYGPDAPTGLTALDNAGVAVLNWNAVPGADAYEVKYRFRYDGGQNSGGQFGPYIYLFTVTGTTATYDSKYATEPTDNWQNLWFVVTAVNSTGESPDSNEAFVRVSSPGDPPPPSNLTTVAGNGQVYLQWSPSNTNNSLQYFIYRSTNSGGPYTWIDLYTGSPYCDTNVVNGTTYYYVVSALDPDGLGSQNSNEATDTPLDSYVRPVAPLLSAVPQDGQVMLSWSTNVGSLTNFSLACSTNSAGPFDPIAEGYGFWYLHTNLVNGTTYYYVLSVTDERFQTGSSPVTNATPMPAPPVPGGLSVTAGNGLAILNWNAATTASSYNVKISTRDGGPYTTNIVIAGTHATCRGLDNGTTYYFVVSAVNSYGEGANSGQVSVMPQSLYAPGAPATLTATAGNGRVVLNWPAATGASNYRVKRSTVSGTGYAFIATVSTTNFTDFGLSNGTNYYYVVSSANLHGQSADSDQAGATPTLTPPPPSSSGSTATIALTCPTNNASFTTPTNVTFTATASSPDATITAVEFYADSTLLGSVAKPPYNFTWIDAPAGNYAIIARVVDSTGGSVNSTPVNITVNWAMKLGQFTTAATDLQIPATGLPITVTRNYDNRTLDDGDFGKGWKLDINAIKLTKSGPLGSGWQGTKSGVSYCVSEASPHLITITLSGGEAFYFYPVININETGTPASWDNPANGQGTVRVSFAPVPGSYGTLTAPGAGGLLWLDDPTYSWNGPLNILLDQDQPAYDPSIFVFTAPDGRKFSFDGNGKVTSMSDRNGNTLTFAADGITHSNGKRVRFTRDDAGHITEVYDPIGLDGMGNPAGPPVLTYQYDANTGDLLQVSRLTDRSDPNHPVYQTSSYRYDDSRFPDYLTKAFDARGTNVLQNVYDDQGRLSRQLDAAGNATSYGYDLVNLRAFATNRLGGVTIQNYDLSGRVISVQSPDGSVTSVAYDERGRKAAQTDALGNTSFFGYDSQDRLNFTANPLGQVTTATFDAYGQPLAGTDPRGNTNAINLFDAKGNLVQSTDALGNSATFGYDANGNRIAETNALGSVTRYQYDASGNLTNTVDALGHATGITYDANGNRLTDTTTRTTSTGVETLVTRYQYDPQNRVVATIDPLGGSNQVIYNDLGQQSATIDKAGRVTSLDYDAQGRLILTTYADGTTESSSLDAEGRRIFSTNRVGAVTQFAYDATGRMTNSWFLSATGAVSHGATFYDAVGRVYATMDAGGSVTAFGYDAAGRRTAVTNGWGTPLQQVSYTQYDDNGNQTVSIDALGRGTTNVYDTLNRRIQTQFPDGTFTQTFYDSAGRVSSTVDAASRVTAFGYDAAGRRTSVTNGWGTLLAQVTFSQYDGTGNLTVSIDALGRGTTNVYDALGHCTNVYFTDGTFKQTLYDVDGRRLADCDQAGVWTTFGYDLMGQLTSVTNAWGTTNQTVTRYEYDTTGHQTKQVDALQRETLYAYDLQGRRVQRTLPGGQVETCTYNALGSLATRVDFKGRVTTFVYDGLNRLVEKRPDPAFNAPSITYAYDALGMRTNMTDASGTTSWTYDVCRRVQSKTVQWTGQSPITLTYTNDTAGRLVGMASSTSQGVSVGYHYDALGRLDQVADVVHGVTQYGYDGVGNLQGFRTPNSVWHIYAYDALNRLTNLAVSKTVTPLANYAYTLGPAGNRLSVAELSGRTANYAYDYLYRLQSETVTGAPNSGSVSYTLDAVGNRLSRLSTLNSVLSTTATFSANDWLASDTVDNNGNTLVGVNALNAAVGSDYDFEDHLVYQSDGTKTVSLRYDGNGNRVRKTVNDGTNIVTTWYLVEDRNPTGYPQVIEEYVSPNSQPSTLNRVYTYGHERICQDRFDGVNWVVSYYGYDGHGSVRLLTDYGGRATDSYEYDAFGKLIGQSSSFQPPTPNSYLYSGEQWDADLGFYYNRARYLNPDTGRFWNMDTHEGDNEDPLSLHKYIYARHNPVDRIDPSGHDDIVSLSVATAMRGAVAGAVLGSISAGFTYAKTGSITAAAQSGLMTYSTVFLATICPLGGLAIGGGSIFSLGINAWVDGITAADAFEMGTMLAASLALHATFSRYGPGFTNVREGPTTTTPTTYTNSQLANRMNKFNYVVTEEGEAIIGPRNQSHVELSQGKPLLAAGEVKIINGQVKLINNASGHYQPSGPMARIAAIKSLKLRGYDEAAGRYVEKTFAMPRPIKIPGWDAATTASAGMSGMDWDDMEN